MAEAVSPEADRPVFVSARGAALTRFGIYKIVRRHCRAVEQNGHHTSFRITPHTFRHTAAVHLLESGVEINVIRAWLGHVSLETTNRYAELTLRSKEDALKVCEFVDETQSAHRRRVWQHDRELLNWLDSL